MQKELKIILLVAHSIDLDNPEAPYIDFEQQVSAFFPGHVVHWVFTPGAQRQINLGGEHFFSLTKAITQLCAQQCGQVLVQPLYLVPGQEFKKLQQEIKELQALNKNLKISLGFPLLNDVNDVRLFTQGLFVQAKDIPKDMLPKDMLPKDVLPKDLLPADQAIVYVGHGSNDPDAEEIYNLLQQELQYCSKKFFFTTLLSPPSINATIKLLQQANYSAVHLVPLMTNPGKKSLSEITGQQTSLCAKLMDLGISCTTHLRGLIENKNAQTLWLAHLQTANDEIAGTVKK